MRKPLATLMAVVLTVGSILPGIRSASFQTASAYAPPLPTLPALATSPFVGPDQASQSLPAPPAPDDLPPEVEETRARQAIDAVLEKHLRYWGPRYQVAPVEVKVEGEWVHGVVQWESQTRRLEEPIHILAHRLSDGTWQALMPGGDGLYLQWVDAVPESLVSTGERSQLYGQAAEADALRQPQATPVVPATEPATPLGKEGQGESPEAVTGLVLPTATPTPLSQQIEEPVYPYVYNGNIWVTDKTGQFRHQLTSGNHDSKPALSPDGGFVAYLSVPAEHPGSAPTPQNICIVDRITQDSRCLTNEAAMRGTPAWSPDSARIAYFENGHLIVVNSDGSGKNVLADSAIFDGTWQPTPVWSPDGTSIACMLRNEDDIAIWLVDVNSATPQRITDELVNVGPVYAFRPASNTLTFLNTDENRSLCLTDLDGRQSECLDRSVEEVYDFAWSSDGRKLIYSKLDSSLWLFDISSQTSRRVQAFDPSWSLEVESVLPDGDSIVLLTGPVSSPDYFVVSLSTGELTEGSVKQSIERNTLLEPSGVAPLSNISAPFEWYRYQGESSSGRPGGNAYCGQTCVAMAIQFAHNNEWVAISDIVDYIPGQNGWTRTSDLLNALVEWNVDRTTISSGDMNAVRDAVNNRGHIVLVPISRGDIPIGTDYYTMRSDPANHFNRYGNPDYPCTGGHWVVVKGISDDQNWVIVYDPLAFNNDYYWYVNNTAKGRERYYSYSHFAQAFVNSGAQAIEILEVPGGSCSAPSLNSPSDEYVHTSSDRTISFDWSPPSNCDPDGYTFRVSTSTNMDIVPGLPDRGEGGTSTVHTFDSKWDNTDLYWSVRACKPCDPYTPGPWASPRRFRIDPGQQQDEGVYLCRNTGYNDCMRFTGDAPSLGDAGFGNDDAESVHIVGDWSAVLFEHEYSGARAVINSSVDNLDNTAVKRNEASSLQVRRRNPAYFTLYDLGDWNGESFGSDRDIRDLGHWDFNGRAESIRVASGHEVVVCADADFHGTCGRTDHDVSDLNAVASGLRNGASSVRVCSGSCPAAPRTPTLSSPGEGDVIPPGSSITFQWSGNGTRYYLEYWGGAQSGNSGWIDSDHWSPGSLPQSGSSYQWRVKAWNGYGESGWSSTRSFTVSEYVFPPAIPSDLSTSTVSQSQINLSWTDNSDNEDGFRIYRNPNYPWGGELVAEVPANVTTYSDAGLPCGADYYYHIRAYNEAGTSRPSPSVMGSTRVCTPELVSPANGSTIDDSTPTFDWHQSGSADTYVIKVANSPELANPVIEEELQGSPSSSPPSEYTPSVALGDGQWYWQVTAQGSGPPVMSEVWSFSVSTATSVQIVYVSEHIAQPGQVLSPTVRVHVNSGHLDPARGDHLVNTDDNTFGAWPVQPIRDYVSVGSSYTFDAVNDASFAMTAPTDEGSYTSLWRVWADADYASGDAAINIVVDGTPPSLYIFSPVQDSMLNTSDIMVEVSATDGRSGINQVEFFADYDDGTGRTRHILGWDVDGSNGWSMSWNATDALDQHVSLAAYAWDNAWNGAWAPDTEFVLDRTTPSSAVSPLNPTHSDPTFTVSWSGDDNLSGIVSYDVQYRDGASGTWTDWLIETDLTLASFIGENDHTYYFRCRAYDNAGNQEPYPGGNGDTYTQVSIVCNDTHEPNDSLSQATGISYGQTVNADICPPGDDDYYVFTGSAGDWIVADIDARMNGSELDSYLYLLDNDGSMITSNDDYGGSLDSRLEYTLPHDGTFYLRVREFSDGMEGDADYFYHLSLHHVEEAPYFNDSESGITGWAGTGLWHQVSMLTSPYPESHSWSHSWWYGRDATGDYDDGSANMGELTSPPIYISTEGYYLRFWSWYETETHGALWDGRSVQISVGGGEFEDVLQLASDPMEEWIPISAINLSPYAGSVIRFRFAFNTIDYMYNNYRGWYVDDFSISTTPPPICSDPHEPNDWTGEATSISYGDSMDAQVCPQGDLDFYTFNGAAGEKIIVDIDAQVNGSYLDSYVYLLDSDGTTYLAASDDAYESLDSYMVYELPHDGTFYIKVRDYGHPNAGGTDYHYTIHLLTDNASPTAEITLPGRDTWLDPSLQVVTTDVGDDESGIRNVTFYWHDANWDGSSDWVVLNDDWDTGDGWTYQLDTSSISEQSQDCVVFIYAYDWAGNRAGYGSYHLGIDRTPPTVAVGVSQMFGDAPFRDFWVHWWDSWDNLSGIASYDIQYRDGASGKWTDLIIGATDTYTRFVGLDSHTYYFRARARDYAGNQSAYAGNNGDVEHTVQTCPVPPDAYEVDDTSSRARWIKPDAPMQIHSFHAEGDQDWAKFYAAAGITYTLATTNTGGHADTVLYLYDRDGATLIASNDDYPGMWPASRLDWQPSVSGFYWIEVEHCDPWAYGCTTEYGLSIVGSEPTSFSQVYLPLVITDR